MVTSWGTSSALGSSVLVCLLLTGCSGPLGLINASPGTTDPANHGASVAEATPPSPATPEPMPTDFLSGDASLAPSDAPTPIDPSDAPGSTTAPENTPQTAWGVLGMRGFPYGQVVASNGVEYNPLFLLELDFNMMLWRQQRLYLFADSSFWGQKAAPGITNANQGAFDFSKREFDFNIGVAWNYAGPWEARVFGYSFNNLNRGNSQTSPSGFNDGIGLENRYYLGETYAHLGTAAFDVARATFLSVGYYPTKSMVDGNGNQFKPGAFARAYLTYDLWGEQCYLYGDVQFIAARSFLPTLLNWDVGVAARPVSSVPRLEFRIGSQDMLDLQGGDLETSVYLSVRYIF